MKVRDWLEAGNSIYSIIQGNNSANIDYIHHIWSPLGSENARMIDDILLTKFGKRKISDYYMYSDDEIMKYLEITDALTEFCASSAFKWNGLFATLGLEYNVLDNVSETTHITETTIDNGNQNRQITDINQGTNTTTSNQGKTQETGHTGEIETVQGNKTVEKIGQLTNDSKDYVIPYDTSIESLKNHNVSTQDKLDNTTDIDITTNTKQKDNDTRTIEQLTDGTSTTTSRDEDTTTDNLTTANTRTFTHDTQRNGNIGVTTNFQLIEGERNVKRYNFYMEVTQDIVNFICTKGWYDSEEEW